MTTGAARPLLRVAVTGASGFVGNRVARELIARGHEVHGFSRRTVEVSGLRWQHWDLVDGPLTEPPPVDAVVHAAAHVDDWDPWPVHDRVTVGGTRHVLATWPQARMVLISSCSVYPLHTPGQHFTEEVGPTETPLSPYVRAKIAQERLVASRDHSVTLRPHAVYGPGDPTLLPRLAKARRRGRLIVPGGPHTLVHLTGVELLAGAAAAAVESEVGGIVNVADRAPLPLSAIAGGLSSVNGWPDRPLYLCERLSWAVAAVLERAATVGRSSRPPLLTRYGASHTATSRTFDTTRLRTELGIDPPATDLSTWHR